MADIDRYAVKSGNLIAEDGSVKNIVTLLGGGDPVTGKFHDIAKYAPQSGRVLGEDGQVYNLVDLLQNIGGGGTPPVVYDEGVVKVTGDDQAGYLAEKVDGVTVQVEGKKLTVKNVDGLTLPPAQVSSLLSGADDNFQNQINDLHMTLAALSAGMRYRGKVERHADMQTIGNMDNGDLVVVLADETRGGVRSMYVYSNTLGMWDFVGAFEFSDAFTSLSDTPSNYTGANGKVLRVDEPSQKLVYDNVRWAEILNKPSSSITDIDAAASQRHAHTNKADIDRIGIDTQGRITIDGVPYIPASSAKQRLYARRTGTEQTLTTGTDCIFNTRYVGGIPYNTSTGVFTLEAGKTYRIMVTASMNTTGYVILRAVNAATNAVAPDSNQAIWMDVNVSTTSWHESSAGPLLAYITPTTTGGYKIRATSVSGTSSLRSSYGALEVMEV